MHAMAAGSTDINGQDDFPRSDRICSWTGPYICPTVILLGSAPTCVGACITSISPSRGLIGATTSSVSITGMGFAGGHVNTPAGIQVSNITTFTDTQIVADFVVSSTASPGDNSVSVSTAEGAGNSVNFFVQVPTSLSMVTGTASGTEGPCTSSACGTIVSFTYQVNDQDTPPQPINASMSFWDSFAAFSPDPLGMNSAALATTCTFNQQTNSGPCGVFTSSNGQFKEGALGACSTVCKVNGACATGGPSVVGQTWHIASSEVTQTISEYCQKVLVNGVQPH